MLRIAIAMVVCGAITATADAAIKTQTIEYETGATTLKSFIAFDDASQQPRPGILVLPEWWGLNDYAKRRAQMLAELGYVALAVDVYGDGKVAADAKEAGALSGELKKNPEATVQRLNAALQTLQKQPQVDPAKLGAIGYCMGGTLALELAESGAPLAAVCTFHAGLSLSHPEDARNIKARVLICNGGADTFVTAQQLEDLKQSFRSANIDWQISTYGGATHSFTNPDSDKYKMPNISYSPTADARSWREMRALFEDVFATPRAP